MVHKKLSALTARRRRATHRMKQVWFRRFRKPVQNIVRWWVLGVSILTALFLFLLGLLVVEGDYRILSFFDFVDLFRGDQVGDYYLNLIVEGVGLFAALALVWFLIERHSQRQTRQVKEGVYSRIFIVRNYAANSITNTTTALFDEPPFRSSGSSGGTYYVRDHLQQLQDILAARPKEDLEDEGKRYIGSWSWILESYGQLATMCHETIRLFGPGLMEYPEILNQLERVAKSIESEKSQWDGFLEGKRKEEQRISELNMSRIRRGQSGEDYPPELLPAEALVNLLALARQSLWLIVSITRVLNDWEVKLPESESRLAPGAFWIWSR